MHGWKDVTIDLDLLLINLFIKIIVLAPGFMFEGRILVGKGKTKFLYAV